MPPCMQISVAPNATASWTRSAKSSAATLYAAGERFPWPKPQKAQPTTQTFVKLMFRLTTKVAVSPAISARSSSAAARISSTTSGRVSEKSAVSSSSLSSSPPRPFSIARGAISAEGGRPRRRGRALRAAPRAAPRDEAPVLELHHVEDALLHPLGIEVLRVGAEALGEGVAARRQLLAHLVRARERLLGADVITVRRQPAQVGGARLDQLRPPVGEVGGHLDADVGHQALGLGDQPLHLVDGDLRRPLRKGELRPDRLPLRPAFPRGLVGDVGHLRAVVARVRNEV